MREIAPRAYRIGFLNPWVAGAEVQAFMSLSTAASCIGHELVRVRTSDDIFEAGLDFVLATEPGQPKVTDTPTFGVIHSPRAILLEKQSHLEDITYIESLLTYDGYLTIADNLTRFLRALCSASDKPAHIGSYYNT